MADDTGFLCASVFYGGCLSIPIQVPVFLPQADPEDRSPALTDVCIAVAAGFCPWAMASTFSYANILMSEIHFWYLFKKMNGVDQW